MLCSRKKGGELQDLDRECRSIHIVDNSQFASHAMLPKIAQRHQRGN
jgi:hypothetical protein